MADQPDTRTLQRREYDEAEARGMFSAATRERMRRSAERSEQRSDEASQKP